MAKLATVFDTHKFILASLIFASFYGAQFRWVANIILAWKNLQGWDTGAHLAPPFLIEQIFYKNQHLVTGWCSFTISYLLSALLYFSLSYF